MKHQKVWWQTMPIMMTAGVAALGALGTFLVRSATYIQLPDAVASVQKKNELQDEAIIKLSSIEETWQKVYQQQTANQAAPRILRDDLEVAEQIGLREWDDQDGRYYCCPLESRDACFDQREWYVCE